MSTKLQSPEVEVELDSQVSEEEQTTKEIEQEIEQEIECPRCHDIMALSSEFDKLLYFCQECSFSLVTK